MTYVAALLSALIAGVSSIQNDSPPLILAVRSGDAKKVRAELAKGADPNAREVLIEAPDLRTNRPGGTKRLVDTALILSVHRNNMEIVRALLTAKADVNRPGKAGWTALIAACAGPTPELVKLLLAKRADPNKVNELGQTPLGFAAHYGQIESVKALLKAGADPNRGMNSPLLSAAENGNGGLVDLLLRHGADPNRETLQGMNVYEAVVLSERFGMADKLRKAGGRGRTLAELKKQSKSFWAEYERKRDEEVRRLEAANPGANKPTEEDRQLIQSAVEAIFSEKNEGPNTILLQEESVGIFHVDLSTQLQADLLPEQLKDVTLEIQRDLQRRNTRPVALGGLAFDPPIRVTPKAEIPGGRRWLYRKVEANGYASAYLPGFSSDRKRAIVRLYLGPSAHGASATVCFERAQEKWMLKWLKKAFYV